MIYRKPTFNDVEDIFTLINGYAEEGLMLARSRNTLYETLRDMVVAVDDSHGQLAGVGALHLIWDELAEVRAMAVARDYCRRGIGAGIVRRLLAEGDELGVRKFITFTYQPGFFQTLGFREITKNALPQKVWKDCIDCPKFPDCDEVAMALAR